MGTGVARLRVGVVAVTAARKPPGREARGSAAKAKSAVWEDWARCDLRGPELRASKLARST